MDSYAYTLLDNALGIIFSRKHVPSFSMKKLLSKVFRMVDRPIIIVFLFIYYLSIQGASLDPSFDDINSKKTYCWYISCFPALICADLGLSKSALIDGMAPNTEVSTRLSNRLRLHSTLFPALT